MSVEKFAGWPQMTLQCFSFLFYPDLLSLGRSASCDHRMLSEQGCLFAIRDPQFVISLSHGPFYLSKFGFFLSTSLLNTEVGPINYHILKYF